LQKCIPKIYFIPLKLWRVFDFILALLEIMQYNLFSVKSYSRKFSWKLNVIVLTCQCLHEKHKYIGYHRACRQVEPIIFSITFRWLVFAKPCSNLCIPKRFVRDIYVRVILLISVAQCYRILKNSKEFFFFKLIYSRKFREIPELINFTNFFAFLGGF